MKRLTGKRLLLGVTGGIAAYKAPLLVRRLRDEGAEVRVVMTRGAAAFVTPLTLQTLSGHPVATDLLDPATEAATGHIELARWADLIVVAPATADALARLAQGRADDLLAAVCLASQTSPIVAPAMNQAMWAHPATQANLATLRARGVICWGPAQGEQACGEVGEGRLLEPEELVECCVGHFATGALAGVRVLVTAGPTREPLDPVRFLGNRSSGKMGYALAQAAAEAGAQVSLVSGPVQLEAPRGVEMINVETAQAMYTAVSARLADTDLFIGAAAVADYRPVEAASQKIKKGPRGLSLQLEATPDILAAVSASGRVKFVLGFAAETENLAANAQKKRLAKGLDLVAANWVGKQRGFDTDDNALELFWEGGQHSLALAPKARLARQLIEVVAQRYREKLQRLEAAGRHAHHSA